MPPIKKMKSNSGWLDLDMDFSPSDPPPRKETKKPRQEPMDLDYIDTLTVTRRRDQTSSLAALLEACDPQKSSELAVSKQKQNELSDWLIEKALPGVPRILVLSGPSGCGKTAALKVLAKENKFDIIEWITPADSAANINDNYMTIKQADKFSDFFIRATRYNSVLSNQSNRKLLLVKDIPNVYFFDKESFYDLLTQYYELGTHPLVFICPDSEASRVQQSLFPAEIVERYNIDKINVNATTPAAMKNMLKRVTAILNAKARHMLHVTQHNIDEVLSNSIGDVRSTLLNVIFTSLKVPGRQATSHCELREESLGLLHGVGRVINPKREPSDKSPGSWKFVHDPDDIASYFQSHASVFLHFLHENYLNTMEKIEYVDVASDIMSLSDTLFSEWRDPNLTKLNLSLCIRGLMVSNETPVLRWNPVRKPKSSETKHQRDLNVAEERYYRSIIRPKAVKDPPNLETIIEAVD
ncbi:cell cycle checkpoint protein RAD17 [Microplitis demolitor]|uniref:cell cycle checkpoint protein RAD17 n=1 Tax=Microplitis demolitor TaxID=69319 RepID=UPI0004CD0CB9|nr:cell cycle checkpoint protein RAD17 [Microplitis demolitor]